MSDWQEVYQDKLEYRAQIVKDVLTDKNMEPVLINKQDWAHHIGVFEVLVKRDHVLKALKIINDDIKFE